MLSPKLSQALLSVRRLLLERSRKYGEALFNGVHFGDVQLTGEELATAMLALKAERIVRGGQGPERDEDSALDFVGYWLLRESMRVDVVTTPLVAIESPYAGEVERNKAYLARAVRDCLERGEAPYASHGFYTQYLNDEDAYERTQGIEYGLLWQARADFVAVYADYGLSSGMKYGIKTAEGLGLPVETRRIGTNEEPKESRSYRVADPEEEAKANV